MKKLIPALVFAAAISSPAFAEKGHNHDDGKEGAIGGMMMGMMSHDQMMAMHKHMQEMHDQMAKIKSETDPDKRHKLMQEHMEAMQKGMQMMNHGMGKGMNMAKHKKEGMAEKMDEKTMMKRMNMMEQRMNMMQMMMGQMMDHEPESRKPRRHRHKK